MTEANQPPPADEGPVQRPVRPASEAVPLVERLREMSRRGYWPLLGDEAADEIERLRSLLAAPESGYTHQCLRCLHPYTPSGANEDCPECGHDGSAA